MALAFGTQRLLHRKGKGITSVCGSLESSGLFGGDIYFIAHTLVGSKPLFTISSWDGVKIAQEMLRQQAEISNLYRPWSTCYLTLAKVKRGGVPR